ncbi:MAG: HEAT repeat domain-containing protein [Pedosphaera sp.]|nr:HEAT repeat domain-containing protein [Pedosphaera sp.]
MKRRWFVVALLAAALLAVVLTVQLRRPEPPSVQGKSVLTWALELNGPGPTAAAEEVFRQVGEEAVPCLAAALGCKDSLLRKPLMVTSPRLSDKTRLRLFHFFDPDEANRLRFGAVRALEIMGPKAKMALPALSKALRDEDVNISMRAAFGLAGIGGDAVPELVRAMKVPNHHTRLMSILALSRIGSEAVPAVSALVEALDDKSPQIARQASQALAGIGRPAVPKLIPLLEHSRFAVRAFAAGSLAGMGPLAREALPSLHAALDREPLAEVRKGMIEALGKIRPSSQTVVVALARALEDEDSGVRVKAAESLDRGGQAAAAAVPALIRALKDASPEVRKSVAAALGSIGGSATSAIPNLVGMASNTNEFASAEAREALEKIKTSRRVE